MDAARKDAYSATNCTAFIVRDAMNADAKSRSALADNNFLDGYS
jgi:hypothetical protein